jgi:hypothetical protein
MVRAATNDFLCCFFGFAGFAGFAASGLLTLLFTYFVVHYGVVSNVVTKRCDDVTNCFA